MAILNQFGKPFAHGAARTPNLPWQTNRLKDIDDLIKSWDHKTLVSASKELYENQGIIKAAVNQKASWTVGNAWNAQSLASDSAWAQDAEKFVRGWYNICDVRGGMYDFKTILQLISKSVDYAGDVLVNLIHSSKGYPQVQIIPAHRIACVGNETIVESGKFAGKQIVKGVIINSYGRILGYRVLKDYEGNYYDLAAENTVFLYDPNFPTQVRGFPLISHAIAKMRTASTSEEYELWAQAISSSIALIERNETGAPEVDDPTVAYAQNDNGTSTLGSQTFDGGMIRYFTSDGGGGIDMPNIQRPSVQWQSLQDRVIRTCITGMGWVPELVWINTGTAATQRSYLAQAEKTIIARQELLEKAAGKIVRWAVANAIELELLPPNEDWWAWRFTKPKKITIDMGRDSAARLNEFSAGIKTLTQIADEDGGDLDTLLRTKAREIARAEIIRQEIEAETGVSIDPEKMPLLSND